VILRCAQHNPHPFLSGLEPPESSPEGGSAGLDSGHGESYIDSYMLYSVRVGVALSP
jgi:hypothetical protein